VEVTTEVIALDPLIGADLRHRLHSLVVSEQFAERDALHRRLKRNDLNPADLHLDSSSP